MRDPKVYLKDILKAIAAIEEFVKGMELQDFVDDDKTSSAVINKFEIIGEAAKNIPEYIREQYSDIPWKEMAGMRDKLIHFYFGVKYDLVWETIRTVIPKLRPKLKEVLRDVEKGT